MAVTDDERPLDRVLKRASQPGMGIVPRPDDDGFAVRHLDDARRRAVMRVSERAVRALRAAGAIEQSPAHGAAYVVSDAGRRRLDRNASDRDSERWRVGRDVIESRSIHDDDGEERSVRRNMTESPVAWLARRRPGGGAAFLNAREFAAAERYRGDVERSTLHQRLTSDWTSPPRGSTARGGSPSVLDGSTSALHARERVYAARTALGATLDDVVHAACAHHEPLGAIELRMGWPKRTAKVVLRIALDRLATHYGLSG